MHSSNNLIDESSRLKQFAWELWDNQIIAVIFRPGNYGLDRYVVKRYVEQVLYQSQRWKQLSCYFSNVTPLIPAYSLTSYEVELMRRILDYHLADKLRFRITQSNDQLIEYEDLLNFICRAQELYNLKSNSSNNIHSINNNKSLIPSIPTIHSSYTLPSSKKPINSSLSKTSLTIPTTPVKSSSIMNTLQLNKIQQSPIITNNHHTSQSSNLSLLSEHNLLSLYNAKIDGNGWIQINNVYLPFIIKNSQRLVPYQILVSCKILEPKELYITLVRATLNDVKLINSMINDCKINSEQIPENTFLINIYYILIGTKNLIYMKILSNDNPTSKINRQYKTVLTLRGGILYIKNHRISFVCSSNRTYIPLNDIINIYPNLQIEFKSLARVPRTYELDYLQLIKVYYNENELPIDTLFINIEDLKKFDIIPINILTLNEYHEKEKILFDKQINLLNNSLSNKRKNQESHENKQLKQKFKPSTPSNQFRRMSPTLIRPSSSPLSSPSNQPNHWLSLNNGHRGKTRLQ